MTSTPPHPAVVLHEDRVLRLVGVGPLLLAAWFDAPTMAQLAALEKAIRAHHAQRERSQVFFSVALDGTPNFSDPVRTEMARMAQRHGPYRAAVAYVVQMPGFIGVAVRSFMSTVLLVARPKAPTRVFDSIDAASRWVLPFLQTIDAGWQPQRLQAALAEAQRRGHAGA